jgi:hypothetical protein
MNPIRTISSIIYWMEIVTQEPRRFVNNCFPSHFLIGELNEVEIIAIGS